MEKTESSGRSRGWQAALPRWEAGKLRITAAAKQAAVEEGAEGGRRFLALGGAIWEERRRSWLQANGEKVVILTGEGNQRRFVWLREVWEDAAAQCIAEKQCIASQLSLVNFVARLSFSDLLVHCGPGSTLAVGERLIEKGFGAARWPSVQDFEAAETEVEKQGLRWPGDEDSENSGEEPEADEREEEAGQTAAANEEEGGWTSDEL